MTFTNPQKGVDTLKLEFMFELDSIIASSVYGDLSVYPISNIVIEKNPETKNEKFGVVS